MFQQCNLCFDAPWRREPTQSRGANHPVARNHNWDAVVSTGISNWLRLILEINRQLSVSAGFSIWDGIHRLADCLLKRIAVWFQRQVEHFEIMRKIRIKLLCCSSENRARIMRSLAPMNSRQIAILGLEPERA